MTNIDVFSIRDLRLHSSSLIKAAKIASLSIEEFTDFLQETEISVINYSPDELDEEMKVLI